MNEKQYFVYILANKKNGVLYIGVTNNLRRRIYEHKNKLTSGFTKKYNISKLVYYEIFEDIYSALKREKAMKKWNREWKIQCIEKDNKGWIDLYSLL